MQLSLLTVVLCSGNFIPVKHSIVPRSDRSVVQLRCTGTHCVGGGAYVLAHRFPDYATGRRLRVGNVYMDVSYRDRLGRSFLRRADGK